jgi:NitT/TauT family transport system permease protein
MQAEQEIQLPQASSIWEKTWQWCAANLPSFIVIFALWEIVSRIWGDPVLFPTLEDIASRGWELTKSGILLKHTFATAYRILGSMVLAIGLGVLIGFAMGRYRVWERFWLPIVAVLLPIPALAWTPVVVLWFGLGDTTMIFITTFGAVLPIISNTWTGAKSVNSAWIRAANSMNCSGHRLFLRIIFPGSLPFVLSGVRVGLARAWRAGVAAEMVAASDWGLGYAIFASREFLDISFMLCGIAMIGLVGFVMEKFIFQKIEAMTVIKWGMMEDVQVGGG